MGETTHTNRLAQETSPYLLQHAHNPVDWYPWGPEALEKAREEEKPIFLSIGYSACHWCHVMEHESFEDPQTAALMNQHFVNIKVDREERPDLDRIYMTAVQLMTRHGGWPMSVWLGPDLKPFYGGTYFPPESSGGMPAFRDVLQSVADAWQTRRDELAESAARLVEHIVKVNSVQQNEGSLKIELIDQAVGKLSGLVDHQWGGIGQAPKFPHSVELRLLLRAAVRKGSKDLEQLVLLSLDRMLRGGIYDQLGGGFHRYSTDERWLVPHFEKMLYDNALIPLAYLEAYQLTGNEEYRQVVSETLDYVCREMTSPEGAYYSTQDADSEGEEGKFFVWTRKEVEGILGEERAKCFCYCYDVSPAGNWEGKCILNLPKSLEQAARMLEMPKKELCTILAECRSKLLEVRSKRIAPGRDEKVLTSWNGMMIETMAVASEVLGEPRYQDSAVRAADFVMKRMRTDEGLLFRTYNDGRARLNGYLEDYSYLANALARLYEATFDPRWITSALEIVDRMVEQFWDDQDGGFFYTGKDHEPLITREKDSVDNAIPSGNAMAVTALVRLYKLTGRSDLLERTERSLRLFRSMMFDSPIGGAQMMIALELFLGPTQEFAIVGDPDTQETREILRAIQSRFLPNKVVALRQPGGSDEIESVIPLLAGKTARNDRPTIYICQNFTCKAPLIGLEELEKELK